MENKGIRCGKLLTWNSARSLIAVIHYIDCAVAAEYYMATDGDDTTGDGGSGNPWLSLQHSMTEISGSDNQRRGLHWSR